MSMAKIPMTEITVQSRLAVFGDIGDKFQNPNFQCQIEIKEYLE